MAMHLILATTDGVVICEHSDQTNSDWRELRRGLRGQAATSVIAREGVILAGTHAGVFRSNDLGATWQEASQGLSTLYVR